MDQQPEPEKVTVSLIDASGKLVEVEMSPAQLQSSTFKTSSFPASPWKKEDSSKRFQQSLKSGHLQVICKCINCSLEFSIASWRNKEEIATAYGSNKEHTKLPFITCPECGVVGECFIIDLVPVKFPIYDLRKFLGIIAHLTDVHKMNVMDRSESLTEIMRNLYGAK